MIVAEIFLYWLWVTLLPSRGGSGGYFTRSSTFLSIEHVKKGLMEAQHSFRLSKGRKELKAVPRF